jgi:hypothetical protein
VRHSFHPHAWVRNLTVVVRQCFAKADTPSECKLQAEDYLECLHHSKEVCVVAITGSLSSKVDLN